MRILVIEDDVTIAKVISEGLKSAEYAVDVVHNGELGLDRLVDSEYELVILDLMLPGRDGLSVLSEMRLRNLATKVLILSAKRSVDERVLGLRAGGDDYLVKPFAIAELMARCEVLLRRAPPSDAAAAPNAKLQYADLSVDLITREVSRGARKLELQAKEFTLLEYLLRHAGQVVSKTQILEAVWKYNFDPQTNVVDVLVHRLRTKIDKDHTTKLIQTIRGIGYVLK